METNNNFKIYLYKNIYIKMKTYNNLYKNENK